MSNPPAGIELAFADALPPELRGVMPTDKINDFLRAMAVESDRGLVIGIISVLDDLMDQRFQRIFCHGNADARKSARRAFGSFGGRVNGLFAMGLISQETYQDLERLREVRNKAAHEWPSFRLDAALEASFVEPLFRNRVQLVSTNLTEGPPAPMVFTAQMKLMWVAMILIVTLHQF